MKMRLPRRRGGAAAEAATADRSTQWRAATRRLSTPSTALIGVWTLLVAGPALGAYALIESAGSSAATSAPSAGGTPTTPAEGVSTWAGAYLQAYLQSGKDNMTQLAYFYPAAPNVDRPANTFTSARTSTVRAVLTGHGVWSVTLAADLQMWTGKGYQAAGLHCFQIPVDEVSAGTSTTAGTYAVLSLPAEVACPYPAQPGVQMDYDVIASTSSGPLVESMQPFFVGLLTGGTDVSRYVTPGVVLSPVSPPPYTAVTLSKIQVAATPPPSADLDAAPAEGTRVRVHVTLVASVTESITSPLEYDLLLTGRGGRWEVTEIQPGPAVSAAPPASSTTPPPTEPVDPTPPPTSEAVTPAPSSPAP